MKSFALTLYADSSGDELSAGPGNQVLDTHLVLKTPTRRTTH